ncbi:MAG: PASTA domain-containing protein, partial [Rhodococcus sp. (in: high G+C Gram-positive bacteria)]
MFTALALFGSGLASGWWLQNELVARQESSTAARPDDGTLDDFAADIASGAMPDLRSLGSDASKQILADSGIPVDRVEVTTRAAAGRPGIVIEQTPPFGSSDTAKVTLVVSTSAQVPVIENRSATEVISELQELGAQVIVKSRYQPDAVRDGALDVDPP